MNPKLSTVKLTAAHRFKQAWDTWTFTKEQKSRLFLEVKSRLSLYALYEYFGGNLYLGGVPQSTHCILHDDSKRSAKVKDNFYVCYSGCGEGDALWFLKKIWGDIPYQAVIKKAEQEFGLGFFKDNSVAERVFSTTEPVYTRKERVVEVVDKLKVHRVYEAIFEYLPLTKSHRENLLTSRKLPARVVRALEEKGYRSYKKGWLDKIIPDLAVKLGEESFYGVPGFYKQGNSWSFNCGSGIIIPARDINGLIQALMVRSDTDNDRKYSFISSSNLPSGAKAVCGLHFIRGGRSFKKIWITEGVLKADVSSLLLEDPGLVIGLPSIIGARKDLIACLKTFPKSSVYLCMDTDWRDKPAVKNGVMELASLLYKELEGQKVYMVNWNPAHGKGLDDILVNKGEKALDIKLLR